MRILRYHKKVKLEPWATFDLVPEVVVSEGEYPSSLFEKVLATVRESGFDFVLYEQEEKLLERGPG